MTDTKTLALVAEVERLTKELAEAKCDNHGEFLRGWNEAVAEGVAGFEAMAQELAEARRQERDRIANLWAGCATEAEGHGLVDIGLSIREGRLIDAN